MTCDRMEATLQGAQWGASLDEQYRRLGGQLSSLKELVVTSDNDTLLGPLGAMVSSAPNLACLRFSIREWLPSMEISLMSSASLECVMVHFESVPSDAVSPMTLILSFLPGCTQLREVSVRPMGKPPEGTAVKIRCYCGSPRCIMPVDVHARQAEAARLPEPAELLYANPLNEVGAQFLPMPCTPQGVQAYTVVYVYHAAGPEQPPKWGHAVVPGYV